MASAVDLSSVVETKRGEVGTVPGPDLRPSSLNPLGADHGRYGSRSSPVVAVPRGLVAVSRTATSNPLLLPGPAEFAPIWCRFSNVRHGDCVTVAQEVCMLK
jgi:hypothetical protein